jgi:hypothetical protein
VAAIPRALGKRRRFLPLALGLTVGACVGTIGGLPDDPIATTSLPAQPLHRLNRLEYDNTVRDLLGTALRPSAAFPPDGESEGFDNMAEALQLTPTLLDGHYAAARLVIDDALDPRPAYAFPFGHQDLGIVGGYPVGDLWALSGNAFEIQITVPIGGATVTLLAGASQIGPAPAPTISFELDGVPIETFVVQGSAAALVPHVHALDLSRGVHSLRYAPTNFVNDAVANTSNNVLVKTLTIQSDEVVEGPGRDRIFVCEPAGLAAEGCYRKIVTTFAKRAWRRPLESEEVKALVDLWGALRDGGESDDQALRLVMRSVMTSPKFIYRARTTRDADREGWLDDFVLASRLSYFLWSSMPDERLFAAAEAGELASEEGLTEAVRWMLADEKAQGLVDGFAEQWLSTRLMATASPSTEVYPFDEALRSAMVEESKLFFGDFLSNDLPMTALLGPDFAYLNDRLAAHYGLPPVGSDDLVRLAAGPDDRTGMLSLSAWLTSHSDAEHSSPIRRGRWLSDRILCQPVPPPPAGLEVPPLAPTDDATVREQLEKHRSDPACASCHALLDVLGMGLERFDGVARVRPERDLDTMGELPDGTTFEGAGELAAALDEETVIACVAQKLMSYSLGRPLGAIDRPFVEAIAQRAVAEGQTLPEVVLAIVLSPTFRSPAPLEGSP